MVLFESELMPVGRVKSQGDTTDPWERSSTLACPFQDHDTSTAFVWLGPYSLYTIVLLQS
jgi:hypothetical protein